MLVWDWWCAEDNTGQRLSGSGDAQHNRVPLSSVHQDTTASFATNFLQSYSPIACPGNRRVGRYQDPSSSDPLTIDTLMLSPFFDHQDITPQSKLYLELFVTPFPLLVWAMPGKGRKGYFKSLNFISLPQPSSLAVHTAFCAPHSQVLSGT